MITQITRTYNLHPSYLAQINRLKPFTITSWDSMRGQLYLIRENIRFQLVNNQNKRCCYCGLKLGETSRVEVEHIAPKAGRFGNYPEFSYYKYNIAAICQYCNSSSKKGEYNPIIYESPVYKKCKFEIFHPYFDDPNLFFDYKINSKSIVISAKNGMNKNKALKSIEIFELDSEGHTEARAKEFFWERKKNGYQLSNAILDRIKNVMSFKR